MTKAELIEEILESKFNQQSKTELNKLLKADLERIHKEVDSKTMDEYVENFGNGVSFLENPVEKKPVNKQKNKSLSASQRKGLARYGFIPKK